MTISELKTKAQKLGLKPKKEKKADIVRMIQGKENNTPCFGKNDGSCGQLTCCFFKDCIIEYKKSLK
jgi:DNA-binding IscR family transcriptional regulator